MNARVKVGLKQSAQERWFSGHTRCALLRCFAFSVICVWVLVLGLHGVSFAHEKLPSIGAAPKFSLTTQDGRTLTLDDLKGKVAAVTFIYTRCKDTCPVLTSRLVSVQRQLNVASDADIRFVAISLTPAHDTPEVLSRYAKAHGADLSRWSFLTGEARQIKALARQLGVFAKEKTKSGDVDHAFLTSLVDRAGTVRVQYMGVRFKQSELVADLRSLAAEGTSP